MNLKSNERIAIIGKTGSGKTVFAKSIFHRYQRSVFFDPKRENSDLGIACSRLDDVFRHCTGSSFHVVYQPFDLNEEMFNEFCRRCFQHGNMTIIMDEVYFICFPRVSEWHEKLIRMGRSRGIGLVHLTQRPSYIDNLILSESEHFIIYRLQL